MCPHQHEQDLRTTGAPESAFTNRRAGVSGVALGLSIALSGLAGCSTQAALSQASHTSMNMSKLQLQLDQFHAVMEAAETARLESMKGQRAFLEEDEMAARFNDITLKAAGDKQRAEMVDKLLSVADFVGSTDPALAQQAKADQDHFDGLLAPLPSTSKDMNAAELAAAKMGVKLSLETRAKELFDAAKDVKSAVKDDLGKLQAAKDAAADSSKKTSAIAQSHTDAASATASAAPSH